MVGSQGLSCYPAGEPVKGGSRGATICTVQRAGHRRTRLPHGALRGTSTKIPDGTCSGHGPSAQEPHVACGPCLGRYGPRLLHHREFSAQGYTTWQLLSKWHGVEGWERRGKRREGRKVFCAPGRESEVSRITRMSFPKPLKLLEHVLPRRCQTSGPHRETAISSPRR